MTAMGSIIRPDATLEERWDASGGAVLLTGTQALVRLMLMQSARDRVACPTFSPRSHSR